jgi:hypothetical protein
MNCLKMWIMDNMEKSIHDFPTKLIGNMSLDMQLFKKAFIFQLSDAPLHSQEIHCQKKKYGFLI